MNRKFLFWAVVVLVATGNILSSLTFDDENGWPLSPDGRGDSLERVDSAGDPNDPQSWGSSLTRGGSPGRDGLEPGE